MQRGADALRPGGSWALTITQHMRRALGAALVSTYGRRECVAPDTVLRLHAPDACRGSAATDPGISGWRCGCNASPPLGGGISVPSLSTWWSLSARWRPTRGDTVAGGACMTPAVLAWWQSAPAVVETGRQACRLVPQDPGRRYSPSPPERVQLLGGTGKYRVVSYDLTDVTE